MSVRIKTFHNILLNLHVSINNILQKMKKNIIILDQVRLPVNGGWMEMKEQGMWIVEEIIGEKMINEDLVKYFPKQKFSFKFSFLLTKGIFHKNFKWPSHIGF